MALDTPGSVDRTAAGDVLVGLGDGVALVARPRPEAAQLAVAVTTESLRTARQRVVRLAATRPASIRLSALRRGRRVLQTRADLPAGISSVRLPRRLPAGVVELRVRATDVRGAVASHRLKVLGTPVLPIAVARRALLDLGDDFASSAKVRRCARRDARRVACRMTVFSESGTSTTRTTVVLRDDGWLQIGSGLAEIF